MTTNGVISLSQGTQCNVNSQCEPRDTKSLPLFPFMAVHICITRKLCYRKDDRAMRAIHRDRKKTAPLNKML